MIFISELMPLVLLAVGSQVCFCDDSVKVTWAKLLKEQSRDVRHLSVYSDRNQHQNIDQSQYLDDQQPVQTAITSQHMLDNNDHKSNYVGEKFPEFHLRTVPVSRTTDSSKTLQKRALDFLYHKFVEPRIHKEIEPRPSLIEELIDTFENHVQKDLDAWNKATPIHQPTKPTQISTGSSKAVDQISSVAQVQPGENEDTFIVTDEDGATHVISVDEIISSLAQMDEKDITELLVGDQVDPIERRSSLIYNEGSEATETSIDSPPLLLSAKQIPEKAIPRYSQTLEVPKKVTVQNSNTLEGPSKVGPHYRHHQEVSDKSRSQYEHRVQRTNYLHNILTGINENEVILIRDKDGDTRLVTMKDALQNANNAKVTPKPFRQPIRNLEIEETSPFITLEDIAGEDSYTGRLKSSIGHRNQIDSPSSLAYYRDAETSSHFSQQSQRPVAHDSLEAIRNSLAEVRYQQQKKTEKQNEGKFEYPLSISSSLNPVSLPITIRGDSSRVDNFSPHSPITIKKVESFQMNNPNQGIREGIANFFSNLIGKKVTEIVSNPIYNQEQYVELVVPKPDLNAMQRLTIPLPKPIHYGARQIRSSLDVNRGDFLGSSNIKRFGNVDAPKHVDPNSAESILKSANVPESIRGKLLYQLQDTPTFRLPGSSQSIDDVINDQDQNVDRLFTFRKEKKSKKHKKGSKPPDGYHYILPPIEYVTTEYSQTPRYDKPHHEFESTHYVSKPYKHQNHHHGSIKTYEHYGPGYTEHSLEPPLVDINLLADIKYLSKFGDDNNSFSFPKVGDASKFVDTSKPHH